MGVKKESVLDTQEFDTALAQTNAPLPLFKNALKQGRIRLREYHNTHERAVDIVYTHAWLVDQLLVRAWKHHLPLIKGKQNIALVAVGGYGRGELHPASDVDLMFLLEKNDHDSLKEFVETLIRFLWDIGIEVGHSVRSLKDCVIEAKKDITVATNLMEARLLHGDPELLEKMQSRTGPGKIWPSKKFFAAKWQEQIQRHHHYDDTAYNLEPNVKEGPGGLRDIQMISWVTQRQFATKSIHDLVDHGFLTNEEYRSLIRGRNFLWQIRNGLHFLAGRREDRLLFDFQRELATQFGYRDEKGKLAVEQLMKRYYRTIKELSLLNEILLQHFQEAILSPGRARIKTVNRRFQIHGDFLEATGPNVFKRTPYAMLELFLIMTQHPQLKGVRAHTIRQLRSNLKLIDRKFRNDLTCRSLFMEILRQPQGITHEMRRMNAYGVLASYLPAFGKIVGQMQHDLFHVYTVDEHVLFVLRNIRRFTVPAFANEIPMASKIIKGIVKPERLYIAALFHDIAKGRGGDHSELGETDVRKFCQLHDLSEYDTRFISWLVRNHLIMSWTSQHLDVNDPDVVEDFASKVINKEHLDCLYLLTVADMRGTSPKVWNDWKGSLLTQLYAKTLKLLRSGFSEKVDAEKRVLEAQSDTLSLLGNSKLSAREINAYWKNIGYAYFLRHSPESLAWHTRTILGASHDLPLVASRNQPDLGATEFLVYCNDRRGLFVRITGVFARQNMNIVDAKLHLTEDSRRLDTFVVLDSEGKAITDSRMLQDINERLRAALTSDEPPEKLGAIRLPRQLKHFPIPTQVSFRSMVSDNYTTMEIVTQDKPGLLQQIAQILDTNRINITSARIATYGERAEDIFFISTSEGKPVADESILAQLKQEITDRLDQARQAS